jgi:hypothetical protein
MDKRPTDVQIRQILKPLWGQAVLDKQYNHIFDYTGSNSQFNNGYDEIYERRLNIIRNNNLGTRDE